MKTFRENERFFLSVVFDSSHINKYYLSKNPIYKERGKVFFCIFSNFNSISVYI